MLSYLESSAGAPLVFVHAPAGYGKTTVLSFLAEREGASARWVRLDERDASLESLVVSLVTAVYGWPITPPAGVTDAREAARWIVGAIQELAISTVVLDDYETVAASDDANALLEAVVERLPAYVRVAIASETAPPFLKRLRLRQMVGEIDVSDLRFDAEDVAHYIRDVHGYELSDADASSVARRSGGCAAVVNLVGQLSHNLPRYLRIDFEALPVGMNSESLTPLLREVLARGGHPPARAARELAQAPIGHPGGVTPADAVLDFLQERHCLAQAYDSDPAVVIPHALLRQLAGRL